MRFLIVFLGVVGLAAWLALFAYEDPGYVMIDYRGWVVETTVVFVALALLALFYLLYYLFRVLGLTERAPRLLGRMSRQRRERKSQQTLVKAMGLLAAGRWSEVEKMARRYGKNTLVGPLLWMQAAQAAHARKRYRKRDEYLSYAAEASADLSRAMAIQQARYLIDQHDWALAQERLDALYEQQPKNPDIQLLLHQVLLETGAWERLLELLPKLASGQLLDVDTVQVQQRKAYANLLQQAADRQDLVELRRIGSRCLKVLGADEILLHDYALYLDRLGAGDDAAQLLAHALKKHWCQAWVYLYGRLHQAEPVAMLKQAQKWLGRHADDDALLLSLGRLEAAQGNSDQARDYLTRSLEAKPSAETCLELAGLADEQDDLRAALEHYKAAHQLVKEPLALPAAEG